MDKTAKETGTKPFKLEAYTPDDIGKLRYIKFFIIFNFIYIVKRWKRKKKKKRKKD